MVIDMKTFAIKISMLAVLCIFMSATIFAQTRIAVLPFQNMDGPLEYSSWCFEIQDSVAKMLVNIDKDEKYYRIVPIDSIEALTAEMNLDPSNPQYETDMWTAVNRLNVHYVISGYFIVDGTRAVLSAFIYSTQYKLPDPTYQAKDIRKKKERILESVEVIVEKLLPGLKQLK